MRRGSFYVISFLSKSSYAVWGSTNWKSLKNKKPKMLVVLFIHIVRNEEWQSSWTLDRKNTFLIHCKWRPWTSENMEEPAKTRLFNPFSQGGLLQYQTMKLALLACWPYFLRSLARDQEKYSWASKRSIKVAGEGGGCAIVHVWGR